MVTPSTGGRTQPPLAAAMTASTASNPAASVPNSVVADGAAALTDVQFAAMTGAMAVSSQLSLRDPKANVPAARP